MTTDTDALLATVREALDLHGYNDSPWCEKAYAALDSLAAELERSKRIAKAHWDANTELVDQYEAKLAAHVESLNATAAELGRVKAERDKALSALREIVEMERERDIYKEAGEMRQIARAAIAEIEGEA